MKTYFYKLLFISVAVLFFATACSEETVLPEEPIIGLGGDDWVRTELDDYLYQNFTLPYNIEVKYKWDPYEVNFNRTLVPPHENRVIPVMETVKAAWVEPYREVAGDRFLREYQLLKYVLVGSPEYQSNGTIILGTAEGGNQISLYAVNHFSKQDVDQVLRMMLTIHHEFAHLLHQKIDIPQEWRGLSTQWYTGTWFNSSDAQAHTQGLISAYAKSSEHEDFVETISYLLVGGQAYYEAVIAYHPEVAHIFRTKEMLVVEYYKRLGVDFRALQRAVQAGIQKIITSEQ